MTTHLRLPPAPLATQREFAHAGLTWLYLRDPRPEHLAYLRKRFSLHEPHLDDIRSHSPRPKLDEQAQPPYLFLVLHIPIRNELARLPVMSEVVVIVGEDFVITISDGLVPPLLRLIQRLERPSGYTELMADGPGHLLYCVLDALFNSCATMLYQIDAILQQIDVTIFKEDTLKVVQELSFIRRDVISLRRIVRPNIAVLRALAVRQRPFLRLGEQTDLGDLTEQTQRIWDMLEEQKEIIEGLDATLASTTSHRINREMRSFTLITVIFLPMTLIASILGMNVIIPYADHPLALPLALVFMATMALAMLALLRSERWF